MWGTCRRPVTCPLTAQCARRSLSSLNDDEIGAVRNERALEYARADAPETLALRERLAHYSTRVTHVPIVVDGQQLTSDERVTRTLPFARAHEFVQFWRATPDLLRRAVDASVRARPAWEALNPKQRQTMFLRAADLVAGKYRQDLNATTMLGQAKTVVQAEIDAAAELADFLRFNALYARALHADYQPLSPEPSVTKNTFRYRGLEGFVAAISPFNFTAIGGNLSTAPALMGNTVLWKPAETAVLSNWIVFQVLQEAGFPPGVVNFVPSSGPVFGDVTLGSPHLAGVNFTGSVPTFRNIWQKVAHNIHNYHNFPRLVGECGGKDYHFVHHSADIETVVNSTIRAAFEYSGQKCSACSRLYVADSIWPEVRDGLLSVRSQLKVGSPLEFDTFMSAVIDEKSFDNIEQYIAYAKSSATHQILGGGKADKSVGFFVEPTIIQTTDPKSKLMSEEIFGPVLTVFVYDSKRVKEALELVDTTSGFALTGAVFATDQQFLADATEALKMSAGNFYINDKCTGAVVAQQPFGGARLSGTNDKAGAPQYLLRWTSPQTIKQNFAAVRDWKYPYMR